MVEIWEFIQVQHHLQMKEQLMSKGIKEIQECISLEPLEQIKMKEQLMFKEPKVMVWCWITQHLKMLKK